MRVPDQRVVLLDAAHVDAQFGAVYEDAGRADERPEPQGRDQVAQVDLRGEAQRQVGVEHGRGGLGRDGVRVAARQDLEYPLQRVEDDAAGRAAVDGGQAEEY